MKNNILERRLQQYLDELHWRYMELYFSEDEFQELYQILEFFFHKRTATLKSMDLKRERHPDWYNAAYGMTLSIGQYAGSIMEMQKRLDYLNEADINFIHITDLWEQPDFSISTVKAFARSCHSRHIHLCVDMPLSYVEQTHEWVRKARAGNKDYQKYFYLFSDQRIPNAFSETISDAFTWIPKSKLYVMTSHHPEEWDLNYRNPAVFHGIVTRLLTLANYGVDMIRLSDLSHLWKALGTSCKDLRECHQLARILRLIVEIVCPGVLLAGNMSYYGSDSCPECHIFSDDSLMPNLWHTVATSNTWLLRRSLAELSSYPRKESLFHYLRTQKPIFWNLDYEALLEQSMHKTPHIKYLNEFFIGNAGDHRSRGQWVDNGFLGTTASMCGLEVSKDDPLARRLHLTVHACLFLIPGVPVLCCGDELALINGEEHVSWDKISRMNDTHSLEHHIFYSLKKLEAIRKAEATFSPAASFYTIETWAPEVLCICRTTENEKLIGLFNFSRTDHIAWINEKDGCYQDLFTGEHCSAVGLNVPACGFYYLKRC